MRNERLRQVLDAFPGKRILILGDVMLDEYIWGDVRRISPEAPVPIVESKRRTCVPGGAANTATNVGSLKGRPLVGGVVGVDAEAARLRAELAARAMDLDGLIAAETRPTTSKKRIVAHSQHVVRLDAESREPLPASVEDRLLRWAEGHVGNVDACVLSDYAKGVVSSRVAEDFIGMARAVGKPVVVDPKGANYAKYRGATILTPNLLEAETASNHQIGNEADLMEVGHRLLDMLDSSALLITRGAHGMSLFLPGTPAVHTPAEARHVFDVTGAGDTTVAALALSLAAGATLAEAMYLANKAAGIVVGKLGTGAVTLEELGQALAT